MKKCAMLYIFVIALKFNLIINTILFITMPFFYDLKFFNIPTWHVALPLMTCIYLSYDYEKTMKEVKENK